MVGEAVGAIRDFGDLDAGEPLRVVVQGLDVAVHRDRPVTLEELEELALTGDARSFLRLEVAQHLVGHAHVERHDVPDGLVRPARVAQLQEGEAQALLIDLGGAQGVAAGNDAPDVGVVRERRGPADERSVMEEWLDDVDIGQVLAGGRIGVVADEHVAGARVVAIAVQQEAHRVVEAAEVHGGGHALGQRAPFGVADSGREIHAVADDGRVRGAHQDQRHLVGNHVEAVLQHFEADRVDLQRHGGVGHGPTPRVR